MVIMSVGWRHRGEWREGVARPEFPSVARPEQERILIMINNSSLTKWNRLSQKQLDQQFIHEMVHGLQCSPFEASAMLDGERFEAIGTPSESIREALLGDVLCGQWHGWRLTGRSSATDRQRECGSLAWSRVESLPHGAGGCNHVVGGSIEMHRRSLTPSDSWFGPEFALCHDHGTTGGDCRAIPSHWESRVRHRAASDEYRLKQHAADPQTLSDAQSDSLRRTHCEPGRVDLRNSRYV